MHCKIFSFMSYLAMSSEIGSVWAGRVGQGEMGRYTQKVHILWPWLACEKLLAGARYATSLILTVDRPRKQSSHLV